MPDVMPLRLGDIQFSDIECPKDIPFPVAESMALYDFAGGIKSVQLFGPTLRPISWSGILMGANAEQRSNELNQLLLDSQPVTLQYSGWSYEGVVSLYLPRVENNNEIFYEITFEPVQANNNGPQGGSLAATPQALLGQAQQVGNNQVNNPASQFQFPPSVPAQMGSLSNGISQALSNAGNNLANVPKSTVQNLQSQIGQLRQQLAGYISGADPQAASAAIDLDQTLQVMNHLLSNAIPPIAQVHVTNPNLFSLAAAYYDGDVSKWELIREANNLPIDPEPIGTFNLKIPIDPQISKPFIPVML